MRGIDRRVKPGGDNRGSSVTVISELASFVTGAKASALSAAERERLRLHFTDTVVAALAGARIPEGRALNSLDDGLAGGIGRQAATVRLTEIDDIHLPSCTTPSSSVIPVALVLAAFTQKFGADEIASAIWVGTEAMIRFGTAIRGPQVLYRGIWPTYLGAPLAAAATASRLLGLNESRTAHALSLACMSMAGGVGRIHGAPSGRWLLFAQAVAAGVSAAEAAKAGYCGDPYLLDKDWLTDTHGIAFVREQLKAPAGASSVYAGLSMKPFCSARQAIAAVEAFREVLRSGVECGAITKVRVRVPPAYAGMIATRAEPGARQSTMVSAAHQIALAALAPDRLYEVDRSVARSDAAEMALAQFAARVEIVADAALATFYPQHWPAEVEVEAGGKTFRHRVVEATGDPQRPLGRDDVHDKAHRVLDPILGAARVGDWLQRCDAALEDDAGCRELVTMFAESERTGIR